jgi:hypothetical protein
MVAQVHKLYFLTDLFVIKYHASTLLPQANHFAPDILLKVKQYLKVPLSLMDKWLSLQNNNYPILNI